MRLSQRSSSNIPGDSIPGWFFPSDIYLFQWFLDDQVARHHSGDLVELGTYYGKSAVLIAAYQQAGETFTVVDLYETSAEASANAQENALGYGGLTRAAFEAHYLRYHASLPVVVQGLSSEIRAHVAPASVRFCHVDASHLYEHVRGDAAAARDLLQPDGIVVFDDYRSPHTPGTAAAVWEAVLNMGLKPIALTKAKLYGTWGDHGAIQGRLLAALNRQDTWLHEVQSVAGNDVVRVFSPGRPVLLEARDRAAAAVSRRLARARRTGSAR